jgi:hypothetical protein
LCFFVLCWFRVWRHHRHCGWCYELHLHHDHEYNVRNSLCSLLFSIFLPLFPLFTVIFFLSTVWIQIALVFVFAKSASYPNEEKASREGHNQSNTVTAIEVSQCARHVS